jgi:hypothetical protein
VGSEEGSMRFLFVFFVIFCAGCVKPTPPPKVAERPSIVEQAEEVSVIPKYQAPSPGNAVGLTEGEEAPFDGILLDEEKATAVAELRISYDETYHLALINRKALISIIKIQERELENADKTIDLKEEALRKSRDSWWQKYKLTIGVVTGVIRGIAGTVAAGNVWAAIDNGE